MASVSVPVDKQPTSLLQSAPERSAEESPLPCEHDAQGEVLRRAALERPCLEEGVEGPEAGRERERSRGDGGRGVSFRRSLFWAAAARCALRRRSCRCGGLPRGGGASSQSAAALLGSGEALRAPGSRPPVASLQSRRAPCSMHDCVACGAAAEASARPRVRWPLPTELTGAAGADTSPRDGSLRNGKLGCRTGSTGAVGGGLGGGSVGNAGSSTVASSKGRVLESCELMEGEDMCPPPASIMVSMRDALGEVGSAGGAGRMEQNLRSWSGEWREAVWWPGVVWLSCVELLQEMKSSPRSPPFQWDCRLQQLRHRQKKKATPSASTAAANIKASLRRNRRGL